MVLIAGAGPADHDVLTMVIATAEGLVTRFAAPEARTCSAASWPVSLTQRRCPSWSRSAFFFIIYRFGAARAWSRAARRRGAPCWPPSCGSSAKAGFAYYLRNLARYAGLYGTLEGVIVLALWLELSVSIVSTAPRSWPSPRLSPDRPTAPASAVQPLTTARVGE